MEEQELFRLPVLKARGAVNFSCIIFLLLLSRSFRHLPFFSFWLFVEKNVQAPVIYGFLSLSYLPLSGRNTCIMNIIIQALDSVLEKKKKKSKQRSIVSVK